MVFLSYLPGFFMVWYLETWKVETDLISLPPPLLFLISFFIDIPQWFFYGKSLVPHVVFLSFLFSFFIVLT